MAAIRRLSLAYIMGMCLTKMGFNDMGEFVIFQELKNKFGKKLVEDDAKALAFELGKLIREKRYSGWTESKREKENIATYIEFWL